MTIKTTLCALVLSATVVLAGCVQANTETTDETEVILYGMPISVACTSNTSCDWGKFAGVFEVNEKLLLAYNDGSNTNIEITKAAAIVQSEIDDEDNEFVKLTGKYKEKEFELSSVEANGYKIDF